MNSTTLQRFFLAIVILVILTSARPAAALDLIVDRFSNDPSRFGSIQAAIDYARTQLAGPPPVTTTYRVVVTAHPTPYTEAFTPISNVPVIGSETAGTFIAGNNVGTLVTLHNVSNVTIKNFTFLAATVGIAVTNSSAVTIANNVFRLGTGNTALQVQGSPTTTIVNNTFYQNGTALGTNGDTLITNNIFAGNGQAIATAVPLTRLTYNAYHNNGSNGAITLDATSLPNSTVTAPDPLFVDPNRNDFHLQSGSPCHTHDGGNAGNPAYPNADNPAFFDMGAYGGPDSDTIPFKVSGLTATSGATSVALNWNLNLGYQVTGYHVFYGTTSGGRTGTGATEGNSPITVAQGVNSTTLSNLPLTLQTTPAAVSGITLSPGDRTLFVTWTPVANATGYKVYYSTTPFTAASLPATFERFDGATIMGVSLVGLTNGTTYYVAVTAIAQSPCYLTITAFTAAGGTPGVAQESAFAPEVVRYLGPLQESALSNVASAVPAVQPIGVGGVGNVVPGGGAGACFIATAAYGYYSAPQVQILRDFRDRYLLTNAPGRAFVAWYYRYGPSGAAFITAHPWTKPLVRLLLLPLLAGAMIMLQTTLAVQCGILAVILLSHGMIYWRTRRGTVARGAGAVWEIRAGKTEGAVLDRGKRIC